MVKKKFVPTPLPRQPSEQHRVIEIRPIPPLHRHDTTRRIFQLIRFMLSLLWAQRVRRLPATEIAVLVRNFIEHMGGLFIKTGQLLSLRTDLFSKEMVDQLSQLQSRAYGFPPELARKIVEDTIGRPISQVFSHYDEMPFAAASVSQEHHARLRAERIPVVLKVQRPNISHAFERDLAIISGLVRLVALLSTWMSRLNPEQFLTELKQLLREELDFRYEAGNLIEMRKRLRKHSVFVPKLFRRYSGHRLIVMEEFTGALMSEYLEAERTNPAALRTWLQTNDIDPHRVGSRLLRSFYRQLFEDDLFHGDLHPGNIMLFKNSRIGLLDLGSVGSLDIHFIRVYKEMTAATVQRDYYKAIDYFLQLSDSVPLIDITALRAELVQVFRVWEMRSRAPGLTYLEKSASGALLNELQKVKDKYGVAQSWQLLRVGRASLTLDSNLAALLGNADPGKIIRKYFHQAQLRAWRALREDFVSSAAGAAGEITELVHSATAVLRKAFIDFQGVRSLGAHFFAALANWIRAAGAFVAAIALVFIVSPRGTNEFVAAYPVFEPIAPAVGTMAEIGRVAGVLLFLGAIVVMRLMGTVYNRFSRTNVRLPSGQLSY